MITFILAPNKHLYQYYLNQKGIKDRFTMENYRYLSRETDIEGMTDYKVIKVGMNIQNKNYHRIMHQINMDLLTMDCLSCEYESI